MATAKITLISEAGRMSKEEKAKENPTKAKKTFKYFVNSTDDQFPYIESAISILDE